MIEGTLSGLMNSVPELFTEQKSPYDSYHHRKTLEAVTSYFAVEKHLEGIPLEGGINLAMKWLNPLITDLTRPRSINVFQQEKEEIISFFNNWFEGKLTVDVQDPKIRDAQIDLEMDLIYLTKICLSSLGIFRNADEVDRIMDHYLSPKEILAFDEVKIREVKEKMMGLKQVVDLAKKTKEGNGRFGLTFGGFREIHEEHTDLIKESAEVLGKNGVLIIGVSSKKTLERYRKKVGLVRPRNKIIKHLSRLEDVGGVFLLDCPKNIDINAYHRAIYGAIRPDFYFVGDEHHQHMDEYRFRSREFGGIVLWRGLSKDSVSVTEIQDQRGG